jgi:gliding motility-associated-like protein
MLSAKVKGLSASLLNTILSKALGLLLLCALISPSFGQDVTPPTITRFASDSIIECGIGGNPLNTISIWYQQNAGLLATDNSGNVTYAATITLENAISIFNNSSDTLCGNTKRVRVGFYALDASGNKSDTSFASFILQDTQGPMILNTVPNVTTSCSGSLRNSFINWLQGHGGYAASDLCSNNLDWTIFNYAIFNSDGLQIGQGTGNIDNGPYPTLPNNFCSYRINISFVVSDECNNISATPTTTFWQITDDIAPHFNKIPRDTTVDCRYVIINDLTSFDSCAQKMVTPTYTQNSTRNSDPNSCGYFNYVITQNWTTTDDCGNTRSHTRRVQYVDNEAPKVSLLDTINISCYTLNEARDSIFITSIQDLCDDDPRISINDVSNVQSCAETINRTYTVSDICNNIAIYRQVIKATKNSPPLLIRNPRDKRLMCNISESVEVELASWLDTLAGAVASSSCGNIASFAAIPGSYQLNDTSTYPGTKPSSLIKASCPSPKLGYLSYVDVDFVFYDACGNATVAKATFGIGDTIKPSIVCKPNITSIADINACGANVKIPTASGTDNCTPNSSIVIKDITAPLRFDIPGSITSIVDTVTLNIGPIEGAISNPTNDGIVSLKLRNMDIDDATEFFFITGEDGSILGQTPAGLPNSSQCQTNTMQLTIPTNILSNWASDGFITLTFIPNVISGLPTASINDICLNSAIEASLRYQIDNSQTIKSFFSIDGSKDEEINTDTIATYFNVGVHQVDFTIVDCANNKTSCRTTVEVQDQQKPEITCPPSSSLYLTSDSCVSSYKLPLTLTVSDNCNFAPSYVKTLPPTSEASLVLFDYYAPFDTHIASSKLFEFEGISPARFSDPNAILSVEFFGDNNDESEYFDIIAPNGQVIGSTTIRDSETDCGLSKTTLTIPGSTFKSYITNGKVSFIAVPNEGIGGPGLGINACTEIDRSAIADGISTLKMTLTYGDANVYSEIKGFISKPKTLIPIDSSMVSLTLGGGVNSVIFYVSDFSGNETSCTTTITVQDTLKPKAICKNSSVTVHPSGEIPTIITPDQVNNGSFDNCRIDTMWLSDNIITCRNSGNDVNVYLYVRDIGGKIDSCLSKIKVSTPTLSPSYIAGLCTTDTLKFFANVPKSITPNVYTFEWVGQNGIRFFTENPTVNEVNSSYSGTYSLTVKGLDGCTSNGTLNVNVQPLTKPSITTQENTLCENIEVAINGTDYVGEISYEWYEGIFPTGVLVKKTTSPTLLLKPSIGIHFYYMIAKGSNCQSDPSNLLKVTILKIPVATVNNPLLTPCEGEEIVLGTPENNPQFEYLWFGPSYNSTAATPPPIPNARAANSGIYSLVILNGECISDTATVRVEVLRKPQKPEINVAEIFCTGANIQMVATSSTNADRYEWYKDGSLFTITQENNLTINNAQPTMEGFWTVKSVIGKCLSDYSDAKYITIESVIEVSATNSGPACVGDSVQLLATFVPNATYTWEGPSGILNIPSVSDPKILAVPGDYFVTIKTQTACINTATTNVRVIELPVITAISSDTKPCMEAGDKILISPSVFPNTPSISYHWSGPNAFVSDSSKATINQLSQADTGRYQLIITNMGCPSKPFYYDLNFQLTPPKPIIVAPHFACNGDSLVLEIQGSQAGFEYIWNTPNQGQIVTSSNVLNINYPNNSNAGIYQAIVKNGPCESASASTDFITIRQSPPQPTIGGENKVCFNDPIRIQSFTTIAGQQYQWRLNGTNINASEKDLTIDKSNKSYEGLYTLITIWNGCPSAPSPPLTIEVKDSIKTPVFVDSELILCSTDKTPIQQCITTSSLIGGAKYTISNLEGTILAQTSDKCFEIKDLDKLRIGTNFIYARTQWEGCESSISIPLIIQINKAPDILAEAIGGNQNICPNDLVILNAKHGPPQVDIRWQSLGTATIKDSLQAATTLQNVMTGSNLVVLHYSIDGCINFSSDTIEIYQSFAPTLMQDVFIHAYGSTEVYDILQNDIVPQNASVKITDAPNFGVARIVDSKLEFTGDPRYIDSEILTYEVCPEGCVELCRTTTVILDFEQDIECKVPNILTPNEDGINDLLIIPCIGEDRYPSNELVVFNEWGQSVFNDKPYRNDWDGTYNGQPCPPGTYFFIFRLDEKSKPIHGFIIIQR